MSLFDSIFALIKIIKPVISIILYLEKQHFTVIIVNFTVYLAISSILMWNLACNGFPSTYTKTIMNLHNRIAQDGLLLLVPVKLTKTHQAHLKSNLYNRQGPTNANGTVSSKYCPSRVRYKSHYHCLLSTTHTSK